MSDDCMWVFVGSFWAAVFGFMVFEISFLPKRKWVGLTDEVIRSICDCVPDYDISTYDLIEFAKAIEAKLKEKNHG